MKNKDLKPCPFCGEQPQVSKEKSFGAWHGYRISCPDLDNCEPNPSTALHKTKSAAKEVWNRRVSE